MTRHEGQMKTNMVPYPSGAFVPERDLGSIPVLECVHLGIEFGGRCWSVTIWGSNSAA